MPEQALVLDTHVWIWVVTGDRTISNSLRQTIRTALKRSRVLIPIICLWEIGMLWKKGRIQLKEPLLPWVRETMDKSGFSISPLTDAIAIESSLLPGELHQDPADRIIVATARIEKGLLLTRDQRIIDYGHAGHVDILKA